MAKMHRLVQAALMTVYSVAAFSPGAPLCPAGSMGVSSAASPQLALKARRRSAESAASRDEGTTRKDTLSRRAGLIAAGAWGFFRWPRAVSEDDKAQLLEGYEIISDLVAHWPKFAGDQEEVKGDSVRRQVGTVGKNALTGIRKVLVRNEVDLDLLEEFFDALTAIDANAYASIFAASGKKKGYMFMEDARKDAKRLKALYAQVLESLELE